MEVGTRQRQSELPVWQREGFRAVRGPPRSSWTMAGGGPALVACVVASLPPSRSPPTSSQQSCSWQSNGGIRCRSRAHMSANPTFAELGVRNEICEALEAAGVASPNRVQQRTLPILAGGANVVLGAQTGSGKTLAYLIPLMQRLKDEEEAVGGLRSRPNRPRALVIVPTRELCEQVKNVAKQITHYLKLRSMSISGGVPIGRQAKLLASPLDLVVATPGRLLQHAERGDVAFSMTQGIVMDEVDTLFEAGFGEDLRKLLGLIRQHRGERPVQYVAVGATHPKAAKDLYAEVCPDLREVMVDVHSVPVTLRQNFVRVGSLPMDKCETLRDVLGPPGGKGHAPRTLIFCNTKDSARFVDHYLQEHRFVCTPVLRLRAQPERPIPPLPGTRPATTTAESCRSSVRRAFKTSRRAERTSWSAPTWQPGASTAWTSPTSSSLILRAASSIMCIARAGPPGLVLEVASQALCPSATPPWHGRCRACPQRMTSACGRGRQGRQGRPPP